MPLTLFQRDDCPLCDQAYELLAAAGVADFEPVWIDADPLLEATYGSRVPVLRCNETELDWPFTVAAIRGLVAL